MSSESQPVKQILGAIMVGMALLSTPYTLKSIRDALQRPLEESIPFITGVVMFPVFLLVGGILLIREGNIIRRKRN